MPIRKDDAGDRVLFFEIEGLTRVVRDCHDVDDIEEHMGFTLCPICGGKRTWINGATYLQHDEGYSADLH